MRLCLDIFCVGGPYDGSVVSGGQPQLIVTQFETSHYVHLYDLMREDEGSYFYQYGGMKERNAATALGG